MRKQYYCKECGKEITRWSKSGLCGSCSHKISSTGRKFTTKTKTKMSKSGIKRFKNPKEREKISKSLIGKKRGPMSEETKVKISTTQIGRKRPPFSKEWIEKISITTKEAMKDPKIREKISGKNNVHYIHGQSKLPYSIEFTSALRKEIRERDNHICQCCGMTQAEHYKKYKRDLEIHHIDHCTFNCAKDNLITTCKQCNLNANKDIDYWFAYYTYIMENEIYV